MGALISKSARMEREKILAFLEVVKESRPAGVSEKSIAKLDDQIRKLRYGWHHEDKVARELRRLIGDGAGLLLNGFVYGSGADAFEIDHLWINKFGFPRVIESKSYAPNSVIRVSKTGEWTAQNKGFHQRIGSPLEQAAGAKVKLLALLTGQLRDAWPFIIEEAMVSPMVVIPDDTVFESELDAIPVMRVEHIRNWERLRKAIEAPASDRSLAKGILAFPKDVAMVAKAVGAVARNAMGDTENYERTLRAASKALESVASYPTARFYLLKAGIPARVADPLIAQRFGDPEQPSAAPPAASAAASSPRPTIDPHQRRSCEASGCARALSDKEMEHMSKPGLQKKYGGRYYCFSCRRRLGRDLAAKSEG